MIFTKRWEHEGRARKAAGLRRRFGVSRLREREFGARGTHAAHALAMRSVSRLRDEIAAFLSGQDARS